LVMPFVGILAIGLVLVSYVPWFSTAGVAKDMIAVRAKAEKDGIAPRDYWMMQCVQDDPNNPQPCSEEDMKKFPGGQMPTQEAPAAGGAAAGGTEEQDLAVPDAGCNPDFEDCTGKK